MTCVALLVRLTLAATVVFGAAASQATALLPTAAFVQAGAGVREDGVSVASVGVSWPWAWSTTVGAGEVTLQTELFASRWRAHAIGGGRQSIAQVGLVPMFRWRPDEGRSRWIVEGGIGLCVTD